MLDVLLVAVVLRAFLHAVGVRAASPWKRWLAGGLGGTLLATHVALLVPGTIWRPSLSDGYADYAELRPLRLRTGWPSRCEP